jgi:hypothetical protein
LKNAAALFTISSVKEGIPSRLNKLTPLKIRGVRGVMKNARGAEQTTR